MGGWQPDEPDRPTPGGEPPSIEIPLVGHGDPLPDDERPSDGPPTNWRRVVGLSSLGGVALGLVVGVVVMTAGDDADDAAAPSTTLDPEDLSATITLPPTLPPIGGDGPSATTSQDRTLFDPADVAATVATLPPLDDDVDALDGFRLSDGTLAALDAPLPRRSVTEYSVGVDGFEQIVTISSDPGLGRYLLEFDDGGVTQRAVVDLVGGRTYVEGPPGSWTVLDNAEIVDPADAPDMATFVRNLQLGPLRSDTRDAWRSVTANPLVADAGDGRLREYVVVLDADAVPEWARYAFGPSTEAAPFPAGSAVGFAAYVAADGSLRRVTGAAEFGATEQRIVHRLEVLDEAPSIELPDPTEVPVAGQLRADELAPTYQEVDDPADGATRDLTAALDDLEASPPPAAEISVITDGRTSLTGTELDAVSGAVRLSTPDSTTLVDVATGDAVTRDTGDADWRTITSRFTPLLPSAVVPVAQLRAGAPVSDEVPPFVGLVTGIHRRFDIAVPVSDVDLPPALATTDGFTAAVARVFVGPDGRVSELHLLLDGVEPRAIVQRFVRPDDAPVVDRAPLDAAFG